MQIETITAPYSAPEAWRNILTYESSGHFFAPSSMRFFGSRVLWQTLTRLDQETYLFVTREHAGMIDETPRYTVRKWTNANGVDTLGAFNGHATRYEAVKALREAAKSHAELSAPIN